ncbi:hypothetical protein [Laspinema sp. D2d]|uniref:hypothetical protein n=1 Tax=Laspinema sp. D2d TaxID=2953686 RepID=UPI0021BA86CE|nr:hypothetical protein [Laspinema sp. D2d]
MKRRDDSNPNFHLATKKDNKIQIASNGLVKFASEIVQTEESLKIFYNSEVSKSIVLRTEFEIWDEYDRKKG